LIGEIVGDYKVVSQLAQGATGEVFAAAHKDTGAKAAIELVAPQLVAHPALQPYLEEVRAVGKIKHAGTMKILDAGVDTAGRGYVISEVLDGDTLAARIEASGRLSITQIGEIGRQLANVLAATHDENIVHGDLRPSVVFLLKAGGLSRGDAIKVTEFGVAKLKREAGIPIGPLYTAPELLGSGSTIDWRVDAYGLGCVAFEMATGKPPFTGASADEVRRKHLEQLAPAARSLMPDVSPALDVLIGRLLSKRPEDRFSSMREVARAFEALGGSSSRPLAPTATDQPVLVLGELQGQIKPVISSAGGAVSSGEIGAREMPGGSAPVREVSSVSAEGARELPPAAIAENRELSGRGSLPASLQDASATSMVRKQGNSKLPIVLVLALVAIIGVVVAILAMR
jgi:serine/threonine-protein kinase